MFSFALHNMLSSWELSWSNTRLTPGGHPTHTVLWKTTFEKRRNATAVCSTHCPFSTSLHTWESNAWLWYWDAPHTRPACHTYISTYHQLVKRCVLSSTRLLYIEKHLRLFSPWLLQQLLQHLNLISNPVENVAHRPTMISTGKKQYNLTFLHLFHIHFCSTFACLIICWCNISFYTFKH